MWQALVYMTAFWSEQDVLLMAWILQLGVGAPSHDIVMIHDVIKGSYWFLSCSYAGKPFGQSHWYKRLSKVSFYLFFHCLFFLFVTFVVAFYYMCPPNNSLLTPLLTN